MALPERPPAPEIRPLRDAECGPAARVLARAFRDNPLNVAVIGGDPAGRLRSNLHGMRALLPVARAHGVVLAAGGDASGPGGVLISTPPYRYPLPPPPTLARLRCVLGQGLRTARRWGDVFRALEARHPVEPHWYLGTLGVDPARQGMGLGRALLAHWLARVDEDAAPAYLETDVRANVDFYGGAGFRVAREADVLGVAVWCMERPARHGPGL